MIASLLVVGAGIFVATPSFGSDAHAETEGPVAVSVNVPLTLAIKDITSSVDIAADNVGEFYTGTTTVKVVTNNATGYTLSMEDDDNDTALKNADYAGTQIDSITSNVTIDATGSNFGVNKWGYSTDAAEFKPIPVSGSAAQIEKTNAPTDETASTVTFGTKVNKDLAAGDYQDTVVFSVVANAIVRDITKWNTLQDAAVHPEYCAATETGVTKTVTDSRDGSSYRIRKLADGNCWMIDDLSIAGVTVTSADTDMESGSYELPDALASGGSYSTSQGYIWQNTGSFAGKYLYNWHAATVSSVDVTTITSGDASSSVCPKGWKLPSGGDANTNQSFAKLYAVSDYASSANMRSTTNGGPEFTLAGFWSNGYNTQGSNGNYWSRTAYPSNSNVAYYLYLDSSLVRPQRSGDKSNGFSVRCVTS